jgi:hypothetical protein
MKKLSLLPYIAISCIILLLSSCSSSKKAAHSNSINNKTTNTKATYGHLFFTGERFFISDNAYRLDSISSDETYGYSVKNPIMVGKEGESGPVNERRFLNALLGPNGEEVTYNRLGSCCMFESPNGFMGGGMMDKYEVTYSGLEKPVILYINMYDPGVLKAPKGFTFKR